MKYRLKVLYIEEPTAQTYHLNEYLKREGFDPHIERVNNEKNFAIAIDKYDWDVIISNTTLAHFNIKHALALLNKRELDIPFIVISDSIPTEMAVELMHSGVNYCLSRKKIQILPSIIQDEIKDAKVRRDNFQIFQKIEKAKQEWEATVDAIAEIIILTDLEGNIIRVNETAIRKFETTYLDLIGTNIEDILLDSSKESIQDIQFFGETQIPNIDGWYDVTSYAIFLDDVLHAMVYLFKDITERKMFEERLERFNRLSGFGTLVASIIGQEVYAPIFASKEKLRQLEIGKKPDEYQINNVINVINDVKNAIDSIEEKMNIIVAYAGDVQPLTIECDMNELIIETLNIIHRRIEPEVEILVKTNLQQNLPKIQCDEEQVMLALLNVLQNSIEALTEGGEITISCDEDGNRNGQIISIHDNGVGISENMMLDKLNSFMTSKNTGKSVGLGLTLAKKIIDMHGGKIEITNNSDAGTQTKIFLPY